jgi:hypothetical protein
MNFLFLILTNPQKVENFVMFLPAQGQALRRQASRTILIYWIPAFARMTTKDDLRIFMKQ